MKPGELKGGERVRYCGTPEIFGVPGHPELDLYPGELGTVVDIEDPEDCIVVSWNVAASLVVNPGDLELIEE